MRQIVVDARNPSTHVLLFPAHESVPSHAPVLEAPTQAVVAIAKPFVGQAPELPVQLSETSH